MSEIYNTFFLHSGDFALTFLEHPFCLVITFSDYDNAKKIEQVFKNLLPKNIYEVVKK